MVGMLIGEREDILLSSSPFIVRILVYNYINFNFSSLVIY